MLAYMTIRSAIEKGLESSTLIDARDAERRLQANENAAWAAKRAVN